MNKKEFKAFINKEYDAYEHQGLTLGQVARDIERRIREANNEAELLRIFRNDVSAHVTPGTESRLDETFDRKKHTHNCYGGPPQLG